MNYSDTPINGFFGEYRWLSNFWLCPVVFDGVTYPSVEHAYQAAKTLDIHERDYILRLPKPGDAKRAGRTVTIQPYWENIKVTVMHTLVDTKFMLNKELQKKLLATGSRELVEMNRWNDTFWGVSEQTRLGANILGKILMDVRTKLREAQHG